MSASEPIEERRLRLQEDELQLKRDQFERDGRKGILGNASVLVTIIAGVSAIAFQGLNYWASAEQAKSARTNLETARLQSDNEWNLRGLQLFVTVEDKLITCDADGNEAHLGLFTDLFPKLVAGFRNSASARANTCATKKSEAARDVAQAQSQTPAFVAAAAETARYTTLGTLSGTFGTAAPDAATSQQAALPIVYIQIASESQRPEAVLLQQVLRLQGYKVPGIERVSTAPGQPEVRYFYGTQAEIAARLADLIGKTLKAAVPGVVPLGGKYKNLPTGVMEFWFPRTGPA